jgi:hypothetical protein
VFHVIRYSIHGGSTKFRLRNFFTPTIYGYVADQILEVSNSQKCKAVKLHGSLDLKKILWIIHVFDDVAYATLYGFCVRTQVTHIWYLFELDLFIFE